MRALAAVLLVAMLLLPGGCVSVLGLDQFADAIEELCKCNEKVPQFGGDCVEVLTARLDNVSEPTRAAWLQFYSDNCNGGCGEAFGCYQQPATCSKFSCSTPKECCNYDADITDCINAGSPDGGECGTL